MEIQGYYLPDGLYYEENHFWVKEEDGLLVLGMDDFAQKNGRGDRLYSASR